MTDAEADRVIREVLVVFPQLGKWFDFELTPEVGQATWHSWRVAVKSQERDDQLAILDEWRDGRRESPPAYDRERVIYIMVELARVRKSNRIAKQQARAVLDNATPTPEQIRERREAYRPIASQRDGMGNAMRRILTAAPKGKPRWEWTRQEEIDYIDNLNRVAAEYAKELGLPKPDPIPYIHEQRAAVAKRQQAEPQPSEEFFAWQGN